MVLGSELGLAEGRLPSLAGGAQLAWNDCVSTFLPPLAKLTRKTAGPYHHPAPMLCDLFPHSSWNEPMNVLSNACWVTYMAPAKFTCTFLGVLKISSKEKYCPSPHWADDETESPRGE